jgi:DNA-binding winged helix-turn-helix (wHTH) protein/tetratricopeptide (TPR) repeat protein
MDREPVFLIYGVGGIGKTEFVYKVIEEIRRRSRWRKAVPLLVQAHPGMPAAHLVTRLLVQTRASARRGARDATSLDDDLVELTHVLDGRPHLVFLDDVHHVDPAGLGRIVAHLSRHLRGSRLFLASRLELPLPPAAPTPVEVRLTALDTGATDELVRMLARRIGLDQVDVRTIHRRSSGSPFLVKLELATLAEGAPPGGDSLGDSLRDLSAAARRALLLASVLRRRVSLDELSLAQPRGSRGRDLLDELARRFLADVGRGGVVVHELVREALLAQVDEQELCVAHLAASDCSFARFVSGAERSPIELIEALRHRIAAQDPEGAWELLTRWYPVVAAAGLDHLLVDELARLGDVLEDRRAEAELLTARIHLRRSLIADAWRILRRVERDEAARKGFGYLALAGEVALRVGRLDDALDLFDRARDAAPTGSLRFQASLGLALVCSIRGDGARGRRILDDTLARLEWPSARHRGRWGWTAAVSFALDERFEEAAETVARAAAGLEGQGLEDLSTRLGMLEILCRIEIDDLSRAHDLLRRLDGRAAGRSALREHALSLYRGVARHGDGDLRGAVVLLESARTHLQASADHIYSCMAGYYLASAMAALGDLAGAIDVMDAATREARAASVATLVPHGLAQLALFELQRGATHVARGLADEALASPAAPVRARVLACCARARANALDGRDDAALGDLAAARSLVPDESSAFARALDVETAEVGLILGRAAESVNLAQRAVEHYARCGRRHDEARAMVCLAGALVARGRAGDAALAEEWLAAVSEVMQSNGYRPLALRAQLVRAAISAHQGELLRSRELLMGALRATRATGSHVDALTVRCALQSEEAPPGIHRLVATLGLAGEPRFLVIDRVGRRQVRDTELSSERGRCELVVEEVSGTISSQRGSRRVGSRPMACKLLAYLIEAEGGPATPEALYRAVWGGREYHPLRHRNTLYVAINRLRGILDELLPGRDVIETVPGGWRLAPGVEACVIRPHLDGAAAGDGEKTGRTASRPSTG